MRGHGTSRAEAEAPGGPSTAEGLQGAHSISITRPRPRLRLRPRTARDGCWGIACAQQFLCGLGALRARRRPRPMHSPSRWCPTPGGTRTS